MDYRAGAIGIAHAHRADGDRDTRGKIMKLTKKDRRQSDTYSDTYSAVEIVAVNKTLILFDIIHSILKIFCPGLAPSKKISFPSHKA